MSKLQIVCFRLADKLWIFFGNWNSKSLSLADLSFFYKKDFVAAPGQVIEHCDSVRQAVF